MIDALEVDKIENNESINIRDIAHQIYEIFIFLL